MGNTPKKIKERGAKVHNLKNINVDIPIKSNSCWLQVFQGQENHH